MDRALPLAGSFLVGVCVFAWLAGPVLEARFGAEALLTAYGAVAFGTSALTYVVCRRIDARLTGPERREGTNRADETEATTTGTGSGGPSGTGSSGVPKGADSAAHSGGSSDSTEGSRPARGGESRRSSSATMDELEALSIEAEVERLKQGRDASTNED